MLFEFLTGPPDRTTFVTLTVTMLSPLENYRWPAEWEPHAATWASWPVNPATWPGTFERIPAAYAELIAAIACFEPANVLLAAELQNAENRRLLEDACERRGSSFPATFIDIPVNDSWCRDHGPLFLSGRPDSAAANSQLILNWDYNAWGGKYPPWNLDNEVPGRIAQLLNIPTLRPWLILEGGAIEGNGQGTVLTTDSCLLNTNRYPKPNRAAMTDTLCFWLQAEKVVWLPGHGVLGDDTDGHIDQIARFVDETCVLVAATTDDDAPEAPDLRANAAAISAATNSRGQTLRPVLLPLPAAAFEGESRLPASYCNFIHVNGAVIVPTFRDPADDTAMQILQECWPDRRIVGVDCLDLIWGLGGFHCLTQQQPLAGLQ